MRKQNGKTLVYLLDIPYEGTYNLVFYLYLERSDLEQKNTRQSLEEDLSTIKVRRFWLGVGPRSYRRLSQLSVQRKTVMLWLALVLTGKQLPARIPI